MMHVEGLPAIRNGQRATTRLSKSRGWRAAPTSSSLCASGATRCDVFSYHHIAAILPQTVWRPRHYRLANKIAAIVAPTHTVVMPHARTNAQCADASHPRQRLSSAVRQS
jgi:hypothetical protein